MFFDGDSSVKRRVNLRGNSKGDQDKKSFLDKQKQERERRLLEKRQFKAAGTIQAFYRGRVIARSLRHNERESWDKMIQSTNTPLPAATLTSAIRSLVFFYNPSRDDARLQRLSELVLSSVNSKDPATSYFAFCRDSDRRPLWILQTKKLLGLAQKKLPSGVPVFAHLLNSLTDYTILNAYLQNGPLSQSIILTLLDYLIDHGLFTDVRAAKTEGAVRLALRRFDKALPLPSFAVAAKLLSRVLSIPSLVSHLPPAVVNDLLRPALAVVLAAVASSLNSLLDNSLSKYLSNVEDVEGLIVNLLDLARPLIHESSPEQLQSFTVLLNFLLCSLPQNVPPPDEDSMDISTTSSTPTRKPIQLGAIADPGTLENIFQKTLSSMPPLPAPTSDSQRPSLSSLSTLGLIPLCRLVDTLTSGRWDSHIGSTSTAHLKVAVLHTLTSTPTIVKKLWQIMSRTREIHELASGRHVDEHEPLVPVLALWAKCYSHILLTLDDQEFFEQQQYFSISELKDMSRVINRIVFRMYWNMLGGSSGTSASSSKKKESDGIASLRTSLTTLVRQLYDRNARRAFVPENHWIIDDTLLGYSTTSVAAMWAREGGFMGMGNEQISVLLRNIPFVIPFGERVKIFHQLVQQDKNMYTGDNGFYNDTRVTIRRNFLFEDGYASLNHLGEKLKKRVRVEFVSQDGVKEAGIDGGGLFKDFITDLVKYAFDPATYALFLTTPERQLYPNPSSAILSAEHLTQFEFLGRILGKAMYDSILIELPLASFFLAKLLGKHNYVNDLVSLDPQLHRNLISIKTYPGNVEEDLALTFTVMDNEFDQGIVKELIPGGKDVPVTNSNRLRYIYLVANYKLNSQIKHQSDAFLRGFSDLIRPEWIRMFSQEELQYLISGSTGGVDVADFRKHVAYHGGYSDSHPVIRMFWEVIAEMTPHQQRDLLRFCTSCSRPPLLGFGYLHPTFAIHMSRTDTSEPDTYLPTASTCLNLLKLPPYTNKYAMKEKLLYAISSNAGFELS